MQSSCGAVREGTHVVLPVRKIPVEACVQIERFRRRLCLVQAFDEILGILVRDLADLEVQPVGLDSPVYVEAGPLLFREIGAQ